MGSESSSSYSIENVSDSCGPSSSRNQRSSDESSGLLEEPSCCYEEGYWINSLIIINKSTGIDIDLDIYFYFIIIKYMYKTLITKCQGWAIGLRYKHSSLHVYPSSSQQIIKSRGMKTSLHYKHVCHNRVLLYLTISIPDYWVEEQSH